jgi:YD repeat-containing protein
VIAEKAFDGRVTRYKLDTAGQVEKITRPSGKPITLERDAMGRITCVRYLDGVERFKHRADGALLEAENDTIGELPRWPLPVLRRQRQPVELVNDTDGEYVCPRRYLSFRSNRPSPPRRPERRHLRPYGISSASSESLAAGTRVLSPQIPGSAVPHSGQAPSFRSTDSVA